MEGNRGPNVSGVGLVNIALISSFQQVGPSTPQITQSGSSGLHQYTSQYKTRVMVGDIMLSSNPLSEGGQLGWISSEPGAGSSVTALTATGDTTDTSATVTNLSNTTGIVPGVTIKIAGVTFGTNAAAYAMVVDVPSATTLTLNEVANQTVGGAALSYNPAVMKKMVGIEYDRNFASVTTSDTGEDDLRSVVIPAGMMSVNSGFKVFAAGTKTGANGNKTLKFYFGAASVTFHAAANNTNDWRFKAYVFNTNATNAQGISWIGYDGVTMLQGYDTAAIDTAAAVTMKITGECAIAGDAVLQKMWLVEPK